MAISAFAKSRLQTVSDSGFARAKKLADLAIKTNVDGKGITNARGYEQAVEFLQPYLVSDKEMEIIDAKRLIADYNNKYTKLKERKNKTNRTVGQFKIDEREIFYVSPTSGNRADIMRDIPNMVSQISEELSLHVFSVENAIEEAQANGDSSSELEAYLFDVQKRQRAMAELNNDYLNDEISPGEVINGYGVYVDADKNDGELLGVMVAPIGDLPPGVDRGNFKRVDSSVGFGGGYVPVLGSFSTDGLGLHTVKIGSQTWEGIGDMELQYSKKKSTTPQFKNDPGEFNLANVVDKGVAMRPGTFSKGYTGFDADGNPKETTFYAGKDGKVYTLDDEALSSFQKDSMLSADIKRATNLDSSFARNLLKTENVEPLRMTPVTSSLEQKMGQEKAAQLEAEKAQSPGFFGKLKQGFKEKVFGERQTPSFFGNRNAPNKPEEPVDVGSSVPDIIEKGKSFFRQRVEDINK